jgi:hypothetical protein
MTSQLTDPTKIYEPDPLAYGDEFRNEYGSVRRKLVYREYCYDHISMSDVLSLFIEYKNDPEYLILRGWVNDYPNQERLDWLNDRDRFTGDCSFIYRFIKSSKRGNDVYKHLVTERLKPLNQLKDITFFSDEYSDKHTSFLFLTLTYNTKRTDVQTAWDTIGDEFHLFISNIKKQYGNIEYFRVWESTQNYYPHIHVLIGFKKHSFPVFTHEDRSGKKTYRIPWNDNKKISGYWHSHVDVQALCNTQGAVKELTKYVTKDLCSDKGNKTNAMIWLFRKQGYGITKGFIELLDNNFANIDISEPTNSTLIKEQCRIETNDFVKWEFIGILSAYQLKITSDILVCDIKKPPPDVVEKINYEQQRWLSNHRKGW